MIPIVFVTSSGKNVTDDLEDDLRIKQTIYRYSKRISNMCENTHACCACLCGATPTIWEMCVLTGGEYGIYTADCKAPIWWFSVFHQKIPKSRKVQAGHYHYQHCWIKAQLISTAIVIYCNDQAFNYKMSIWQHRWLSAYIWWSIKHFLAPWCLMQTKLTCTFDLKILFIQIMVNLLYNDSVTLFRHLCFVLSPIHLGLGYRALIPCTCNGDLQRKPSHTIGGLL